MSMRYGATPPNYSDPGFSYFPDGITLAIDEERRRHFNSLGTMYEGFFVITVTYFPPVLAQAKFVELMFDDDSETMDKKARTRSVLAQFKQEVATLGVSPRNIPEAGAPARSSGNRGGWHCQDRG
jgi:hypothetical protein